MHEGLIIIQRLMYELMGCPGSKKYFEKIKPPEDSGEK
jgi:hypothetical protein